MVACFALGPKVYFTYALEGEELDPHEMRDRNPGIPSNPMQIVAKEAKADFIQTAILEYTS